MLLSDANANEENSRAGQIRLGYSLAAKLWHFRYISLWGRDRESTQEEAAKDWKSLAEDEKRPQALTS